MIGNRLADRPLLYWLVGLVQLGLLLLYLALALFGDGLTRPRGLTLAFLLLPLIVVLPGLLAGRYRAMVWAALVDLFYLTIAITDAWSPGTDLGFNLAIAGMAAVGFIAAWWHSLRLRRAERNRTHDHPR